MRALIQFLLTVAAVAVVPFAGSQVGITSSARAQSAWAAEPTYRFAGRYEGEWTADVWLEEHEPRTSLGALFEQRAGQMAGAVTLDVGCDGTVAGQAHAQTRAPAAFAATVDGEEGPRVLSATLDLVVDGALEGGLASRAVAGPTGAEAALGGTLRDVPGDLESAAEALGAQRWFAGSGSSRWALAEGQPGRLAGSADGSVDLLIPDGSREGRMGLRVTGRWVAARTAIALCPWRAAVIVRGAFGNEQLHDEQVEVIFRPTGDGRLEGEGRGQATIRGGRPGGCEYSGGGPFAVHVVGEARDGVFRLRLEDYEQSQLLLTTTCASGRFVGPQVALSTLFGVVELPEALGGRAHVDLPPTVADARGALDVTIDPVAGGAVP
jgi:hypothetical protein